MEVIRAKAIDFLCRPFAVAMAGAAMRRVQSWWRFRHQLPDGTPERSVGPIYGDEPPKNKKSPQL